MKREKYGVRPSPRMPVSASAYAGNSLVYDGGFERDISGGGFGWRQTDAEGADFDFDTEIKHSGGRAARLTFDGTKNFTYENLFQYVLVSPVPITAFKDLFRTDQISTESGMRFEIVGPKDHSQLDVLTRMKRDHSLDARTERISRPVRRRT